MVLVILNVICDFLKEPIPRFPHRYQLNFNMVCMQYTVIAKALDYQFMPDPSIGAPTILYVPPLIFSNGYSLEVIAILNPDSPELMTILTIQGLPQPQLGG